MRVGSVDQDVDIFHHIWSKFKPATPFYNSLYFIRRESISKSRIQYIEIIKKLNEKLKKIYIF